MSKRKTELERKEDALSVLTNEDHDKVVALQKQLGLPIGKVIEILNVGEICVAKTTNTNPSEVAYKKVRLVPDRGLWVFVDGNKDDGYGSGRDTSAIGETYTILAPDMEQVCLKKLVEQNKSLESAADQLESAGLREQATMLRDQITANVATITAFEGSSKTTR